MTSRLTSAGTWITAGLVFFTLLYFARALTKPEWLDDSLGAQDWDLNFFYTESAARSLRLGELPFWNPYYKGGMPLLENPQARSITPTTLLAVFLGAVPATKLSVLLYFVLGAAGSLYLICGVLKIRSIAAAVPVTLIPFTGYLPQHIYAGHANFISIALLPWAVAGYIGFFKKPNKRYALMFSMSVAWMIWDGHIYGFLQCLFLFSVWTAARMVFKQEGALRSFAVLMTLAAGFAAYRLIPEAVFLREHGAYVDKQDTVLTIAGVLRIFFASSQHPLLAQNWEGQEYSWWEYGNYTGIVPAALFAVALFFLRREELPVLIPFIVVLLLIPGDFHPLSPAHLLSYLPGYGNMRSSGRWSILLIPLAAIVIATGTNRLLDQSRAARPIVFLVLLAGALAFAADIRSNRKPLEKIFVLQRAKDLAHQTEGEIRTVASIPGYGANSSQFIGILNNLSVRDAYEMLNSSTEMPAFGEPDYRGEFYLEGGGVIHPEAWSPNRIRFTVNTAQPDRVIINQNFRPGWQATNGFRAEARHGLTSIPVPAGESTFEVYYRSVPALAGFAAGAALVVLGLFCLSRLKPVT